MESQLQNPGLEQDRRRQNSAKSTRNHLPVWYARFKFFLGARNKARREAGAVGKGAIQSGTERSDWNPVRLSVTRAF